MTQNQIAYQNYVESKRSNEAREAETQRSNVAREAETHRSNLANEEENKRFHSASIAETNRANVARETETNRSNLANEMLKATEIRTRSEDTRYTADVGYQGRVDAAYISKWGVSPTDVSSLGSTLGKGVKKLAPGAKGVAQAAFDGTNTLAANIVGAPFKLASSVVRNAQQSVNKVVNPATKSTRNKTTKINKVNNRRENHVKEKK